jgi:Protein of unknown function (DUF1573)
MTLFSSQTPVPFIGAEMFADVLSFLRISLLTCLGIFPLTAESNAANNRQTAVNSQLLQEKASADPKNLESRPKEILGKVVVQPKTQGGTIFPDHLIDLGETECGKKYLLKICLVNESKEPLSFNRVGANCSCVELRVPKGEVPEGESLDVEVLVSVPEKLDSQVFLMSVDFFSDKNGRDESPFLRVRAVSKKVRGLICFGAVPPTFEVGKSLRRLEIPLLVTEPINPKSLKIETSETLSDAVLAISADGEREELVIDIAGIVLDEGFLDCWVRICDPNTKRMAEAHFLLEKTPMVSVSPKIVSFSRNGKAGNWKTKAFMLLDQSVTQNDEASKSSKDQLPANSNVVPSVKAVISGKSIDVTCTPVRPGLYRLELTVPESQLADLSEGEVRWSVEHGSFQSDFTSFWRKF